MDKYSHRLMRDRANIVTQSYTYLVVLLVDLLPTSSGTSSVPTDAVPWLSVPGSCNKSVLTEEVGKGCLQV